MKLKNQLKISGKIEHNLKLKQAKTKKNHSLASLDFQDRSIAKMSIAT